MFDKLRAIFRKPTALEIAITDLEQAKRDYLAAMLQTEYYTAQASYCDKLIRRLGAYVVEAAE